MNQKQWTAVDKYLADLFIAPDETLDGALEASNDAGLPAIQVSAHQGKLLYLLARISAAKRILEIGTLGGYSTLWLARAIPAAADGGRLVTLEAAPIHADVARANIARAGFAGVVDVIVGPAIETLPKLAAGREAPFDLIFLDADKTGYPDYLPWCLTLSRPGTVIVADNIVRQGAVANADSTDASVRGVRQFNELIAANPRLEATAIQTVGTKGYDGFVIAVVGDDSWQAEDR